MPDIVYYASLMWVACPIVILSLDAVIQPDHSDDSESWLAELSEGMSYRGTLWTVLACAWTLHLGMLHQNAEDEEFQVKWIFYCETRTANQVLGIFRLAYVLNKMIMYPLPSLGEAAMTTAPYSAAFFSHTLLISAAEQLAAGEETPLLFDRTTGRVRERTPLLKWNALMTGVFYTLFTLAISTDVPSWRSFLALAGTLTHTSIYLSLAYYLHVASGPLWERRVPFCGGSYTVRVGAAHRVVCVSLVVQAIMTLLSLFARPWFQQNFAFAQCVFFGAEMVPAWLIPIAVMPIPEHRRRRFGLTQRSRDAQEAAIFRRLRRAELLASLREARETSRNAAAPPLDEDAMRSLVWRCTKLAADGDGGDSCSICLEPMLRGESVLPLGCAHIFHAECLLSWLGRSATCPLCKAAVLPPAEAAESCRPAASSTPTDQTSTTPQPHR